MQKRNMTHLRTIRPHFKKKIINKSFPFFFVCLFQPVTLSSTFGFPYFVCLSGMRSAKDPDRRAKQRRFKRESTGWLQLKHPISEEGQQ